MATLYATGVSVGNGADLTEDVLQTYTMPSSTMSTVGDIVHIVAGGTFAASTDTKTARIRFGGIAGSVVIAPSGNAAGQARWTAEVWIVKTGAATQSFTSIGNVVNTTTDGSTAGTTAIADTAPIQIVITGQNATNSVAGSIAAQYFHVRIVR